MTDDERIHVERIVDLRTQIKREEAELARLCAHKVGDVLTPDTKPSGYTMKGRWVIKSVGVSADPKSVDYKLHCVNLKNDNTLGGKWAEIGFWIESYRKVGTYDFDSNTFTPITETAV